MTNDFKERMRQNLEQQEAAAKAHAAELAAQDKATADHFAATQAARERDAAFYRNEEWARTNAAKVADKAASDALLAAAAANKKAKEAA